MKQWTTFVAIIFLWSAALQAQTFNATILGGFNMSQIEGDRLAGYRKLGISAGAKVSADISDRWSLSTELAYSQQGARRGVADYSSSFESIHFNFVEVPVLAHFSDWKLKVGAGLSYARLIDSEVISFSGEDVTELFPWRENQWAIVFDGLYAFSEKWALNIRWSRQLSTLLDDDEQNSLGVIDPNAPEPIPFHGFMVTTRVGYTF